MHHGIKTVQISFRQIPYIFANLGERRGRFSEIAAREEVGIKADYFVAGRAKHGRCHRSYVSFVARQQYSHALTTPNCSRFALEFAQRAALPVADTLWHSFKNLSSKQKHFNPEIQRIDRPPCDLALEGPRIEADREWLT